MWLVVTSPGIASITVQRVDKCKARIQLPVYNTQLDEKEQVREGLKENVGATKGNLISTIEAECLIIRRVHVLSAFSPVRSSGPFH